MNVEHKSTRPAQTGAMDGRFGKPKAAGTGGTAADAGGFMSVLMSLGASDGQDALALATAGEPATDDGKKNGAQDLGTLMPGLDTSPAQQSEADIAQILQQQRLVPAQMQQPGADAAQVLQQQGLVPAQVLQPQGGAPGPALGQMGTVSATQAAALAVAEVPDAEPVPTKKGGGVAAANKAAALLARSGPEQPTGRPDVGNLPVHAGGLVTRAVEVATSGVLSELIAASAPGGEGIRQAMRQADRNNGPAVGAAGEGGWGASAFQVGGQMDVQAASASADAASPEAAIAQQVHYWISNDVQNAELKLDNWGQSPVEVSISLQGNEARVEFRTDVPELREILEGASAQLKDMLQGEGLVLSGVSVGSSGAGGAGAREQSPRPDMRRATVALPETAAVAQPRRAGSTTGQAVDVFV
jgi:flagellar hook-length control protein FliK